MDPIITTENLSKKYLIGHQAPECYRYIALRDVITNKVEKMAKNILYPFRKIESDRSTE